MQQNKTAALIAGAIAVTAAAAAIGARFQDNPKSLKKRASRVIGEIERVLCMAQRAMR